jgi:hypothetical protein
MHVPLCKDRKNYLPASGRCTSISSWIQSGPGNILRQRSNAARSSTTLKMPLQPPKTLGIKLRRKVPGPSLIVLRSGSWLSEAQTVETQGTVVLDFTGWDVKTAQPTEKPGMMNRMDLPETRHSLSHTTSESVARDRLEIKAFRTVSLASRITPCDWARKSLNDIRLSSAVWVQDCAETRLRERIASLYYSVHKETRVQRARWTTKRHLASNLGVKSSWNTPP